MSKFDADFACEIEDLADDLDGSGDADMNITVSEARWILGNDTPYEILITDHTFQNHFVIKPSGELVFVSLRSEELDYDVKVVETGSITRYRKFVVTELESVGFVTTPASVIDLLNTF